MADESSSAHPPDPADVPAEGHAPLWGPGVEGEQQAVHETPPELVEPSAPVPPPAVPTEVSRLSERVQSIIDTAERSAAELREQTEVRARERIAEAARAADNRVRAAEEEATEIVEAAREEAHRLVAQAKVEADSERARGREEARRTLSAARTTAKEAMERGQKVSGDLEALGGSLRRNAQTILRDVQQAHRGMLAQIDAVAGPESSSPADREPRVSRGSASGGASRTGGSASDEPELPAFVQPRTPRPPRDRSRDPGPDVADLPEVDIEIPEFSREYVPQRHRRRR